MYLIQGRLAVALGFSAAAHAGLAWMVSDRQASNAAPAQRALTVALAPAAPRAVLNSIAPAATAALSPRVVQPLPPQRVQVIESPDAVVAEPSIQVLEVLHAPLARTYGPEHTLVAREARAVTLAMAVAPGKETATARATPPTVSSPARQPAHGKPGNGAEAGASRAVAGTPGADRQALPASGNEPPAYPWSARAQGHQGRVVLSVWVSAEGEADRLAVLKSSGYPILDRAAVAAVEHWRFQPARRGGRDTSSLVYVPVVFRLDDG